MSKYLMMTRIIKVYHPYFKDVLLFEAVVQIKNFDKKLVKDITRIDIKYELVEKN